MAADDREMQGGRPSPPRQDPDRVASGQRAFPGGRDRARASVGRQWLNMRSVARVH